MLAQVQMLSPNTIGAAFACALQGFDEYMNLVLDEAEEVSVKRQTRKTIGALNPGVCEPGVFDAWPYWCCRQ
jgi:LSM domain